MSAFKSDCWSRRNIFGHNKASSGANEMRDRWLKERAQQHLRTECDDASYLTLSTGNRQQLFFKSALCKVIKCMIISSTITTNGFSSKRMNCSCGFKKMLGMQVSRGDGRKKQREGTKKGTANGNKEREKQRGTHMKKTSQEKKNQRNMGRKEKHQNHGNTWNEKNEEKMLNSMVNMKKEKNGREKGYTFV